MSIDIVVKHSKQIEANLRKLGADGKGLHELITSLDEQFEGTLIKKIRFVASVRNAVIHEEGYELSDATLASYVAACNEINEALKTAVEERIADQSAMKSDDTKPRTASEGWDHFGIEKGQATSLGERLKAMPGQQTLTVGEVFKANPWLALSLLSPVVRAFAAAMVDKPAAETNVDSQPENLQKA